MMMMSVCTLLIINELQQIRQAIMENPAQVNYEIKQAPFWCAFLCPKHDDKLLDYKYKLLGGYVLWKK